MRFVRVATLDAVQPPYNLFEREIEADVLPYATSAGLTVLSYGALCRGLLSGRMTAATTFEGDDLRKVDPKFQGARFHQYLAAVEELKRLAQERFGKSVLALAVRWVLDQGPTIALWGARRPEQLDPIDEVDGWHIDEASKRDIDTILKRCIVDPFRPNSWRRRRSGPLSSPPEAGHLCFIPIRIGYLRSTPLRVLPNEDRYRRYGCGRSVDGDGANGRGARVRADIGESKPGARTRCGG